MKAHPSTLLDRIVRAGLRVKCRFRVVAVGFDHRRRIIGIATNSFYLPARGRHAEERLIHRCPKSLTRIVIARIGAQGMLLPIDPCERCRRAADKAGIRIEGWK